MKLQFGVEATLLKSAIQFAEEAGQLILEQMNHLGTIEEKKNPFDLVTRVDKMVDQYLVERIQKVYPEHWILSEEGNMEANSYDALRRKGQGFGWIIDPIDGTTNFIHGIPQFAVSIGVVKDFKPCAGVVYNPMTKELFYAGEGEGAFLNGTPIKVGQQEKLSEAILATGFMPLEWVQDSPVLAQITKFFGVSRNLRILGAASLDLCWVASGRLTGYFHNGLNPWDTAAGMIILKEAGGKVTNGNGEDFSLFDDCLVSTNGKIHNKLLDLLNS